MRGIIQRHCEECHLGGKKKEFDGCDVCEWEWSMCRCKCREHGEERNCPVEDRKDCHRITEWEYIIYQGKSETFKNLVKDQIYEWNGETYRLVNEEFKDEEQEDTKPIIKNIFEDSEYDKAETSDNTKNIEEWLKNNSDYEQLRQKLDELQLEKEKKRRRSIESKRKYKENYEVSDKEEEYEEKVIKRTEIPSSPKYSENSESEKSQRIIITPEELGQETTNTSTATYTPSSQGTFNILFSNPATPPQVQTPPIVLPMANIAQIAAIVTNMQAPKLESYYGRENEDPIHWLAKLQRTERQLQWGGAVAANINAGDPLANIKLQVPFHLRENAAEWFEQDKDNITQWNTNDPASFSSRFIAAMLPEQTKEKLRYELENIQQIGSVQEYVIKFRQALRKIGDVQDLPKEKKIFTNGLKTEIRSKVRKSAPADIAAVITRAKEIELAIFEENNRNRGVNLQEIKQQIKQEMM